MKKIIKTWGGNGLGIYITKDDVKILKLKEGDIVDVIITKIKEVKK